MRKLKSWYRELEFAVGDRVMFNGWEGQILCIKSDSKIGWVADVEHSGLHNLDGKCPDRRGYWVGKSSLKRI